MKVYCFCLLLFFCAPTFCAEKTTIRLGILPFGTVNWELTALQNAGLADNNDFNLEIKHIANPQAGKIALQAGAVDMIVSDWIWVSRMRSSGADYTFYPYSNTSGALVVAKNSRIKKLADLKGTVLGIAGGELDKNWLLLQALALQQDHLDLNLVLEKVFAAPPLLNQQLLLGRIDAIMNYWHYAARLEAEGFKQLLDGKQILAELGIKVSVPSLGYVFRKSWGQEHKTAVNLFLQASRQSKNLLCHSDAAWQQIIPLTKAENKNTQQILRQHYCAGIITSWGETEKQAAQKIYHLLRKLSKQRLTGPAETIEKGTFWPDV